jgi:hypothetical protein
MKKAIEVLKNEVDKCKYMEKFFDTEFKKYMHETSDQTELNKLKKKQDELEEIKESCLEAIEYLKTVR